MVGAVRAAAAGFSSRSPPPSNTRAGGLVRADLPVVPAGAVGVATRRPGSCRPGGSRTGRRWPSAAATGVRRGAVTRTQGGGTEQWT
jgi:hypothetical protein